MSGQVDFNGSQENDAQNHNREIVHRGTMRHIVKFDFEDHSELAMVCNFTLCVCL